MPKINLSWIVQWDRPITFPTLTGRIHAEGLGLQELIEILKMRNEELCDHRCGPRYHPIGGRYRRAGTKWKILGCRFGKFRIKVSRVKDTWTGRTFVPLWKDIIIVPGKIYQKDIIAISNGHAERMTYRDSTNRLDEFVLGAPSPRTINRHVIDYGTELSDIIHERELKAMTHQPDGTKLHAKEKKGKKRNHHDVNIVLATNEGKEPKLRSLTVGRPWTDIKEPLQRTVFQNGAGQPVPPTVVSDMERGLANLVTPENGFWQPCLIHVVKGTGFSLWGDGLSMGEEKKRIVGTVNGLLAHLRNSLEYHLPKGEKKAVEHRIKQTTKEFRRLATILYDKGFWKTARFLRELSNAVTTFAVLALQGIKIPWHNNRVERLMGEVSKRFKHKWMSWTEKGAQSLLTLLVVRIIEPGVYRTFFNQKLYGTAHPIPDMGVQVIRLRNEI